MTFSTRKNQFLLGLSLLFTAWAGIHHAKAEYFFQQRQDTAKINQADTTKNPIYKATRKPTFRPIDRYGDPFSNTPTQTPLFLKDPKKLKLDVEIDTALNYTIYEKIGDLNYRPTSSMSFGEFKQYQERQLLKEYWQNRSRAQDGESAVSGRGFTPKIFISPVLDRIFGGSYVELVPRGFVTLDFGAQFQKIANPAIPIRQQRNGGFQFDQQINMSVVGKIGEKLTVTTNFDNNNSFDFQNNMKVEYTGFKEDILKKLEIGNVSLPLNNTLIQGAQNLFGIKAQMQFGKLNVTAIASTQRGKTASIDIQGGSSGQGRPFEIVASNYDDNRNFFLGHFFRDNYQVWIGNPPQITSGINVTRVEVYVLNRQNDTQTLRNVVGLMDLAEGRRVYNPLIPSLKPALPNTNEANGLFNSVKVLSRNADGINGQLENLYGTASLSNGTDFEKITGSRKLAPTEYTFHKQLGYITLTRKLQNDEALAVAYEYTYNGRSYKVGELSEDYASLKDDEVVFLKLLRPRKVSIRDGIGKLIPSWDLMMKNIYNMNVNQLTREGFQLRIIYRDDRTGIDNPQLQEGTEARKKQLIDIFGLDKLNPVNDPQRDGNFDFIEGITINTQTGLIIFPYLEPFSQALKIAFKDESNKEYLINKYSYDTLYRSTKADAELAATKNKFFMVGQYSAGSSSEILIPGFGVSQGSVKVYAGGIPLLEGSQYTIDYIFGKVTILDQSILNSGKNISIKYEQADPFAFQTRSLLGTRLDYKLSDDVNLGGTFLYYNERPLISRNAIGSEPARNMEYGVDFNVNKKSRILTKIVDALPFLQTKETSTVTLNGEFAQLLPGTSNIINGEGTAYIDDFENSATPYSLLNASGWKLASIPRSGDLKFDPTFGSDSLDAGFRRAKIAWYTIDNQFYRTGGRFKPGNIDDEDLKNHYVRAVGPLEIFPYRQRTQGNFFEQILDIAYYPSERGPYNYSDKLKVNDASLLNPFDNWGGITTAIRTEVDFDKANIEYVEFWMLDPFITTPNGKIDDGVNPPENNTSGGKFILQLGSISEDLMRDSRHAFENGLPPDGDLINGPAKENNWGYVTTQQYLTNAFDNSTTSRANQDVGLDGIPTTKEVDKFMGNFATLPPATQEIIKQDPSADNFHYFLGSDLDANDAQLLERYKNYNGHDGNSPIISGSDDITPSGSPYPDNEDLNADNTLSELEEYYGYDIDLKPGQLKIGKEYVVDKITTDINEAKEPVTWYLFRIPVRQFETKFGNISGFKSIRYARMILTEFSQPVVLRLANFRMVGSRWRRYTAELRESDLIEQPEPAQENYTVSVVNLEENGQGDIANNKSPYRIPPGVVRDRDNTSSISRQLNEQSVQLCIEDLQDGDARAIYKNVTVDLFNYGKVKMYFHADSELAGDGELHGFLRLGTDFDQNYYEIELPLKISHVTNAVSPDLEELWPTENQIDLDLNELYGLKAARDREKFPLTELYPRAGPKQVGRHLIRIFGRPDMSGVKLMMIGVKNPKSDDKKLQSVCIWANELRVTEFNRTPGWAVNGTINAKLADFATVTGAIRHTTFGFGSVSSKIGERTRDETTTYDISANVNIDKLLPGNTGIKLPMFVSYENTLIKPNYDPANPDMKLQAALASYNTDEERAAFQKLIQDHTTRKSLNFTNVRKNKVKQDAVSHIYDIENFSFSYSYSEALQTNYFIKESLQKQYRGSVAYTFTPKATGIEPFKDSKGLKSPWLKLIKDFNLSLLPSSLSVRGDLDRSFGKKVYRNSAASSGSFEDPNYLKYFTFIRTYNMRWNFSKNLSLEYTARANAIVDEPEGDLDTQAKKDSIVNNLKKLGRMKNFDQSVTLNYTVPLDKLPITDWIGADYRYQASYNWKAGPINKPDGINGPIGQDLYDSLDFKNIIQNSRDQNLTGRLDMVKLYNKIGFLKKLNTPPKPVSTRPTAGKPTIQKPPPDTVRQTPVLIKGFFRLLMSLRSINGTYTLTEGTILPGFTSTPKFFGMDSDFNSPGWGFVLGNQDPNIRFNAANKGWLTKNTSLTMPFSQNQNKTLSLRANIEPSSDFKIQLDFKKETSASYQEIFRFDPDSSDYVSLNPNRSGSYRISILSINTTFDKTNDEKESNVFHQFEENLGTIKKRFDTIAGSNEKYDTAQDILIPAFLAAYTGKDANTVSLSPFPRIPFPNWRVDYTGLNKLNGFKDVFQSVTISHAYSSNYSVTNYSNSLQYDSVGSIGINVPIENYNNSIFASRLDENGKLVPVYVISQVLISEQFAPLIGISVRTKSRVTANFQYKTKRDLALNISNAQITELTNKDISFEIGYTKNNMKLPFKSQGRTIVLKNDVTMRLNFTVSDSKTIQRKIGELNTVTNGNVNFQLRPNINYVVNQKLNLQVYYEYTVNEPVVSNSYRRATTKFGVQIRFSLAQ